MKELLGVLLTAALLFGASLMAVELLNDRELFVSPPDAIAEGFTREVMTKRYPRAQEYLKERVPEEELEELQSRLPEGENVDAETTSQDDEKATVEVTVKPVKLSFELEWDKEWKVSTLPKVMDR